MRGRMIVADHGLFSQLYQPMVQRVASRSEFDDVMQEMVTELRTSHLGAEAGTGYGCEFL